MTVRFHLKNPKDNNGKLRNTDVSIYAVVTKSRTERFTITIDERVEPKYWDFKNQFVKSSYRGHYEINSYLEDVRYKIQKLYRENRELPFEKFKTLATRGSEQKKTLFIALDQFIDCYHGEKDHKTYQKYIALKTQLEAFDKIHNIDFADLNMRFYDNFKSHLYAIPNLNYKKHRLVLNRSTDDYSIELGCDGEVVGLFDDTVYKYIINLKTFLKWAEKRDYQVIPSYKSWDIIRRKHEPISLTKEELSRLQQHIFEKKSEDIARDYLVLQCLTGQRISDIKRFNLKNFSHNQWTFVQKKGSRLSSNKVTVPFHGFIASALDVLQKYNWQLPEMSEQKINKHIKTACKMAGIDAPVEYIRWARNKKIKMIEPKYAFASNHLGRKTFVTLALQEGLPIEDVMAITGISKYDTIKHYRGRFDGEAIKKHLDVIDLSHTLKKVI